MDALRTPISSPIPRASCSAYKPFVAWNWELWKSVAATECLRRRLVLPLGADRLENELDLY